MDTHVHMDLCLLGFTPCFWCELQLCLQSFSFDLALVYACMCAKLLQSCLALFDPLDCSLPGSSVHGILQARILTGSPLPGDLPDPGIKPASLVSPALQSNSLPTEPTGKPLALVYVVKFTSLPFKMASEFQVLIWKAFPNTRFWTICLAFFYTFMFSYFLMLKALIHLESIYTIQYKVHIPVYIFPYDFPVITSFIKKSIFNLLIWYCFWYYMKFSCISGSISRLSIQSLFCLYIYIHIAQSSNYWYFIICFNSNMGSSI